MSLINTTNDYGFISKIFHWLTAAALFIQIPLGFYLVDLDFGEERIAIESIHIIVGLSLFYTVLVRLIYKIFNPTPKLGNSIFPGQKLIAKLNHFFLYLSIFTITISGMLKKLFNGEKLNLFFSDLKIKENFDLADLFYDIHIIGNYTLLYLISLHILAVIAHKILFKENLLKKIL
jgi:superoxide oxidase